MEMADANPESLRDDNWDQVNRVETSYTDDASNGEASALGAVRTAESTMPISGPQETTYRTYKMRWFGLGQLVLLNIVVSWDVSNALCSIRVRKSLISLTSTAVAVLLACSEHSSRVLQHQPVHNQLAIHRFSLCFRCCNAIHDLYFALGRPPACYPHIFLFHPHWKLDPLRRYESCHTLLWPLNVRTDACRNGATFRSLCANKIFGPLVYASRPSYSHCRSFARQSIWRSRGATSQPIPRYPG